MSSRRDNEQSSSSVIDRYLAALATRLSVTPDARATILEEIRGHLEEATAAGVARGLPADEAEAQAVASFGSAAQAARSFNATLPVYWDWRRMALGLFLGVVAIWAIWTLVTFPFLVQMATEHRLIELASTSPGALLFTASPLGFGLFYTLPNGPWAALLVLLLFGAVAFALGSRASQGWRAGLAFGLGVIIGLPFLPISLLPIGQRFNSLTMLPGVLTIWMLAPYAIFAARLGARFARIRDGRRTSVVAIPVTASRRRSVPRVALAGLVVLVALLAFNGWSLVRALTPDPAATARAATQQLATAQAELSFTIHQPSYLPDGMALSRVIPAVSDCNPCVGYNVVILKYSDSRDGWIEVTEQSHPLAVAPTTVDFSYSAGPLTSRSQEGWLGSEEKIEQQIMVTWNDGTLDYTLSTNMQVSRSILERIATSLSR